MSPSVFHSAAFFAALLVLLANGCKSKDAGGQAAPSPCDADGLAAAANSLSTVERSVRSSLAGAALGEACPNAPPGLKQVFGASEMDPSQRPMLILSGLSREPALLIRGCAGGPRVLADLAAMAPAKRAEAFLDGCKFDAEGRIASRAEYLESSSDDLMAVMLAHAYMGEQGEAGPGRALLRALMGL
jgi:hypothetical protein